VSPHVRLPLVELSQPTTCAWQLVRRTRICGSSKPPADTMAKRDDIRKDRRSNYQICLVLALTTTALRICEKVRNGELGVFTTVVDYLRNTDWQQITSMIIKSMGNKFSTFIDGIKNDFSDLEFVLHVLLLISVNNV
jgi:hypothetical protein